MTINQAKEGLANALLKPINTAAVVLLGVYTVVWGVWVANPFWTVFTQAPLYSVLAEVAPEYFWGCVAIFCGIVTIIGAVKRSYRTLVNGAIVACWHWSMISIFYFLGDPLNTGGITALTFAIYASFVYLNIKVNHKK